MEHVRGGVVELGGGELFGTPVAHLLLFGDIDADEVLQEIFEPVPVGEGADEFRRDLGAVDGGGKRAEGVVEGGDVEPAKVEEFQHVGVCQHAAEVGRLGLARHDLDEVAVAVAARHLDEAEPVAAGNEAHRLAIDGDDGSEVEAVREIAAIEGIGHGSRPVCMLATA